MELMWEDLPVPQTPFFTRDQYDKFSLAPTIKELWSLTQCPTVSDTNTAPGVGAVKSDCAPITEDCKNSRSTNDEEDESWSNCETDDVFPRGKEDNKDCKVKAVKAEGAAAEPFPEPRLPYPCTSSLSSKDQKTYLSSLTSKKHRNLPQNLKAQVDNEVSNFMRYLHDVSRMCADDYNYISQGAVQYTEDFFSCCLQYIRSLPQLYQVCEMTSLTGGTFNPALALTFEKQLLTMGSVNITDQKIVPNDAQLATDYQSVSSENPPAKKAEDKCSAISSDSNAEKLSARYEPHVCLTRDAIVTLLDNYGPDFRQAWELPVWVKFNPEKGSKTVYIDSPLLKTEVTIRERSQLFHEESIKLSVKKNGEKSASCVLTERPATWDQVLPDISKRSLVSCEDTGLDFDGDFTDLETFGDTVAQPKKQKSDQNVSVQKKTVRTKPRNARTFGAHPDSSQEDDSALWVGEKPPPPAELRGRQEPHLRQGPAQEVDGGSAGDSEDERLVIDDLKAAPPNRCSTSEKTAPPPDDSEGPSSESSPPRKKVMGRASKRAAAPGDQLGQILRMQSAMLKPTKDPKGPAVSPEALSPPRPTPPGHAHPTSLVKPCVSSYLESSQNQDREACSAPTGPAGALNSNTTEHKKLLSEELLLIVEDERDFEAPQSGSVLYKLYRLSDMLVMVRTEPSLAHVTRVHMTRGSEEHLVPVHILSKMEYQLSYGAESLTSAESCRLWAEALLNSSTESYIAHINAHTSKVSLLRKLPDDWMQKVFWDFKPSKSLNILHHILKKLTGLEEGRYVLRHKAAEPFVTIFKAGAGKATRRAFDQQGAHCAAPATPAGGPVPWVPVDPALVLRFHKRHGRPPCTFPPAEPSKPPPSQPGKGGATLLFRNSRGSKQPPSAKPAAKKKNKGKRAQRRLKWMEKMKKRSNQQS